MNFKGKYSMVSVSERTLIFWVLVLALFVRLIHLAAIVDNPMTYQPGADELFYLDFAKDVSKGQFGFSSPYFLMDPLYGYLLGFLTWLIEENNFIIYVFQIIVDVSTVFLVYVIGKELWDHRAGVIAAIFYALTSTAIFYTATVLKPTIVANYIALWVLLSIRIPQSKSYIVWLGYGIFLGLGVALRSNLLLLSLASFFIAPLLHIKNKERNNLSIKIILLLVGFSLPSCMLATRNGYISNHWSILPPNSGIVLHQLYNPGNPDSIQYAPDFVSYGSPAEILSGYVRETEKRLGQQLSIYEISEFWRNQALGYIALNPDKIFKNIVRKTKEFIAFKEIDNSRFLKEEAVFSPILTVLPQPFGWLISLGLPGILLIFFRHKVLSLPIIIAVSTVFATFIIFIAAARFRAHGLPLFAVGSGAFIVAIIDWKNTGKYKMVALIIFAAILGILSFINGKQLKSGAVNPIEFAWGYLKMGEPEKAREYALRQLKTNPMDEGSYELLGFMALNAKQHEQAILYLSRAAQLEPQHHVTQYNLALSLSETRQFYKSLVAIETALKFAELPDYLFLRGQILEEIGDTAYAESTYDYLIKIAKPTNEWQGYVSKAKKRLNFLKR